VSLLTTIQRTPMQHDRKELLFDGFHDILLKLRTRCQEDGATDAQVASISDTVRMLEDERTNICAMFFD